MRTKTREEQIRDKINEIKALRIIVNRELNESIDKYNNYITSMFSFNDKRNRLECDLNLKRQIIAALDFTIELLMEEAK